MGPLTMGSLKQMKVLSHSLVHRILPPDVVGMPLECFEAGHEVINEVFHHGFHVLLILLPTVEVQVTPMTLIPGHASNSAEFDRQCLQQRLLLFK